MVADWPGPMTTALLVNFPVPAVAHRSPVTEVTAGSNALVVTVAVTMAVPAGAGPGEGPHSLGRANQPPCDTVPPDGLTDPVAVSPQSSPGVPLVLAVSGSPANGPKSNIAGSEDVCDTWMPDVSVGTSHSGSLVGGNGMVLAVSGASVSEVSVSSRGSMKKSSGSGPLLVTVTGIVTGFPPPRVLGA